jgi:AcrR family transcriptional regulator
MVMVIIAAPPASTGRALRRVRLSVMAAPGLITPIGVVMLGHGRRQAQTTPIGATMSRWQPAEAMRGRILEAADRLFYFQGIRAVGMDAVAAACGISNRTLYNHFPSKDVLVMAYLERRFTRPEPSEAVPAAQILGRFARLERLVAGGAFRGCPFVNAVAELGAPDHPANAIAVAFKEQQRLWFRGLLEQAGAVGADLLATQLALLVDGAIAACLVRGDPAMARAADAAARVLLRAAGVAAEDDTGAAI